MKNKKIRFVLLIWILVFSFFIFSYKIDGKDLPSTIPEFNLQEKIITDEYESSMLSYGPYRDVDIGQYIIAINYVSEDANNKFDIAVNSGKTILSEGFLKTGRTWAIKNVAINQSDKLEVRTTYNGIGNFNLKAIYIIPVTQIALILFLMIVISSVIILLKTEKAKLIISDKNIVLLFWLVLGSCLITFTFIGCMACIYCGIVHYILRDKMYNNQFEEIDLLVLNIVSLIIMEFLNMEFYSFLSRQASIYSFLLMMEIYIIVFLAISSYKLKNMLLFCANSIILVYGTAQYIYYSFFGNFFRLNSVLLAKTAIGVSRSLEELFGRYQAICYLSNVLFYIIASLLLVICRKERLEGWIKRVRNKNIMKTI